MNRRRLILGALILAFVMLASALAGLLLMHRKNSVEGFSQRIAPLVMNAHPASALRQRVAAAGPALNKADYQAIGAHLLEGFLSYGGEPPAQVFYPGVPSYNGRTADGLEGYARIFPFAALWLADGGTDLIETRRGPKSLSSALTSGLIAGTDPDSPSYWGVPGDNDQRIVEAADIALGLWLARERIWPMLSPDQHRHVLDWLRAASRANVFQGVWQLYPVQIERVLASFGESTPQAGARARTGYERFLSLYRGDGWFFDMPKGFDFYNAWGIHYALFWIDQIDAGWDRVFIRGALSEFAGFYKHLFGPQGFPLMGRSLCYRMAAPAPLLAASMVAPAAVSTGEALRALDLTWSHYIARGALDQGRITQGICGDELAVLDAYSGPASCLWSLRSLILAFHLDRTSGVLAQPRSSLPVERADFSVYALAPGWRVDGSKASGEIRLLIDANQGKASAPMHASGLRESVLEWLAQAPRRPKNTDALYHRPTYSNLEPLSACPVR